MSNTITRDGRVYRRVKNYQFRMGDPSKDVNIHGNPIQTNYVVIVKKHTEDMAFPHSHGLTNKVFGPVYTTSRGNQVRPIFWVEDCCIYKTLVRVE